MHRSYVFDLAGIRLDVVKPPRRDAIGDVHVGMWLVGEFEFPFETIAIAWHSERDLGLSYLETSLVFGLM